MLAAKVISAAGKLGLAADTSVFPATPEAIA